MDGATVVSYACSMDSRARPKPLEAFLNVSLERAVLLLLFEG